MSMVDGGNPEDGEIQRGTGSASLPNVDSRSILFTDHLSSKKAI
jgi:hypothetical protein